MFKAKQKRVSLLVACLTMLLTMLFGFATLFTPTPVTTASAAEATETINIYANKGTVSGTTISWSGDHFTFTNVKGGTNLRTSDTDHYRAYNGSTGAIAAKNGEIIKKVVITCTATSYTDECQTAFNSTSNATVSGSTVIITPTEANATSITYESTASAQWRLNKIVVTYEEAAGSTCDHSSMSYEINGTTKVCTCDNCDYTYNQFQFTYSYPSSETFNGKEASTWETENETITLPTTTAPDGYVFAGWADAEITTPTTEKPTLYKDTHKVIASKTFYAVYHLVTDVANLATGDIVTIAAPASSVAIGAPGSDIFTYVAASFVEGVLQDSDNLTKLTLTKNDDGTYSFYTGSVYLALTSNANKLHNTTSITTDSSWKITIDSESVADIQSAAETYTRYIRYNSSSPRFACYTSGQVDVKLYKYTAGGTISYTSSFCDHSGETTTTTTPATCTGTGLIEVTCDNCGVTISSEIIEAKGHGKTTDTITPATCTEAGSTTVTCDDCGETLSTTPIEATGHSLDEGVITTEPQIGVEGEKTYTCQNGCGYTETESIPALDATKYTISYSVSGGMIAPPSEEVAMGANVTLPNVTSTSDMFTFVGWVETNYTETMMEPETIYHADDEYTLTVENDVTLYALFTYSVGTGDYLKVTDASTLAADKEIVIVDADYSYALSTAQNSNNRGQAAVTKNEPFGDDVQILTLKNGAKANTFGFYTGSGYLHAASNSGNYLRTQDTLDDNASWLITIDENGVATIKAQGSYTRNWLRYNNSSKIFSCYAETNSQKDVSIYMKDGGVYYATDLTVKIESASLTIGTDLKVNYKVTMPAVYADATMQFTMSNKTVDVKGKLVDGQYVFSLPVPPQCMTDNIQATLYFGETVLASKAEYSIQTYAKNQLDVLAEKTESELTDKDEALKQLLTDMLYYGAAAQTYKAHNTSNLATNGVENLGTPSNVELPEVSAIPVSNPEIDSYPVFFTGANVWFGDVNKIIVKVNTTENAFIRVNDGEKVALTSMTFETASLYATQLDTEFVFALYQGETLMQTLTYSVNAYACKMKDDATMGALATALYYYGVSAKAYAESLTA